MKRNDAFDELEEGSEFIVDSLADRNSPQCASHMIWPGMSQSQHVSIWYENWTGVLPGHNCMVYYIAHFLSLCL